jgi:hypothetical protein
MYRRFVAESMAIPTGEITAEGTKGEEDTGGGTVLTEKQKELDFYYR